MSGDPEQRRRERCEAGVVLLNVEAKRGPPDRLHRRPVELVEGARRRVGDASRSDEEVLETRVVEALGEVDVLVPEEELVIEAAELLPGLATHEEAGARRLPHLG